jgi:hypothetical protein
MTKQVITGPSVPTANLAVNKSRLKIYNKEGELPTYYLQKGQEFQIELFNPTQDTILAKIILNGNPISQGGLVLKPGERVFLDRYIDVAKKFLFDTYEVSNSEAVKKAIEKNGDFRVEFYRERTLPKLIQLSGTRTVYGGPNTGNGMIYNTNTIAGGYVNTVGSGQITLTSMNTSTSNLNLQNISNTNSVNTDGLNALYCSSMPIHDGSATMDFMPLETPLPDAPIHAKKGILRSAKSTIETGRVEEGSKSDQKLKTVNKSFEYWAFHTVMCKMLPLSQKINTVADINVKKYCTNCGTKVAKNHKFCSGCGNKA